ncbi:hypothetical protein [Streptomyces sp. NPDC051677]|uniref:hypothetical protein n=1 Tax=Streptomyces sp. NPDC051677 TaxID=3365669 RepID=UPI0037D2D668
MTDAQPELPVELDWEDVAAFVAHFTAHPNCAVCGGRAEVRPGRGGRPNVVIWHEDHCEMLAKALESGARPADVQPQPPATFRSLG